MTRKSNLLLLIFLLSLLNGTAQELSFRTVSVENGLSNNFVKTIFRDKASFIWIGTLEGLDRYDGAEIKSYSKKKSGIKEAVNAICESANGDFWLGTETGLYQFDKKKETYNKVKLDKEDVKVLVLLALADKLYIGTNNGMYICNVKSLSIKHLVTGKNTAENLISGIIQGAGKEIWVSTSDGLLRLSGNDAVSGKFRLNAPNSEGYNAFTGLTKVGAVIYLGTKSKGVVCFNMQTSVFYPYGEIGNNLILNISSDDKNMVFAGTDGGGLKIIRLKEKKVETISHDVDDPSSISSNSVYSFLYDNKKIFWIGTFSAGLSYNVNSAGKFKNFLLSKKFYSQNKSIRSFCFAPNGDKFLGTRDGFLAVHGNSIESFKAEQTSFKFLRANIILAIYPLNDKLLLGTYGGGACLFDKASKRFSDFIANEDFQKGCIYGFSGDSRQNIWIATLNGVFCYNSGSKKLDHYTGANSGLINSEVFSVKVDSKQRIWAGTVSGVCFRDPKTGTFSIKSFPAKFVNKFKTTFIYEDKAGNIWLCTEKGGLFKLDAQLKNFVNYTIANGLPDNSVCAVVEDNSGDYWISTLKGFCRLSGKTGIFQNLYLSDGLPGLAFNPAACYKSATGELWWGNEKGLIYFHPDSIADKKEQPTVRITGFFLSGKEVEVGNGSPLLQAIETTSEIELPHRQNSIGFKFVALNYANPANNQYACMLEGYDHEWKQLENRNQVYYDKLPAGTYVFKVKLMNSSDTQSSIGQMRVVIKPYFFMRPSFIGFIILVLGIGVWQLRLFRKRKKKKNQDAVENSKVLPEEPHEKYKGSKITEDEGLLIKNALIGYIETQKPYLNAELKMADLSQQIGYSAHDISQVLNQYLNQSFSDFINAYRVEEVKRRMSDDIYSRYTLTAIALQSGFNSKTSFFRVFKKVTGKTPADYFKDLRAQ
ncbi:MAG: two-component regulator propeller domain-containing protein [Bacteroidota bacterium]|nr:two-component regulator propeller domain-containing protein [Bacteroidota bacterium]